MNRIINRARPPVVMIPDRNRSVDLIVAVSDYLAELKGLIEAGTLDVEYYDARFDALAAIEDGDTGAAQEVLIGDLLPRLGAERYASELDNARWRRSLRRRRE
jgi:hypothetical protein